MMEYDDSSTCAEDPEVVHKDYAQIATTPEDDAHRYLRVAIDAIVHAMCVTLDESIMQQCGSLIYQVRRVQARLE